MAHRIFVVDDDPHYARLLSYRLEKNPDHRVRVFARGEDALAALDDRPHLVLLDIMMPGIGGIETLRRLRERAPETAVVMVSAQGVVDTAVEAMKLGAYDYVTKGQDDLVKLDAVVRHVLDHAALAAEVEQLRAEVGQRYALDGMIGASPAMQRAYALVQKALRGDLTVAILGESGTGKELVARAIHYASPRRRGPFVVVNCAAIPRDLMESEFFGHEKGSFTGAHARKLGRFEQADGGTLFLDEVGELDLDLQAKLLRALQNREVTRVGGSETIHFDARVISATNQDVGAMLRAGRFREDLYYRLFQFPVALPPLRERGDDRLVLAEHFLRAYVRERPDFRGKRLSAAARRAVLDYPWPGNVRELKSAVERAVLIADGDEIGPADLLLDLHAGIVPWPERAGTAAAPAAAPFAPSPSFAPASSAAVASFETFAPPAPADDAPADAPAPSDPAGIVSFDDLKRTAVERAYRATGGNVDRAAVELGIGRATMYRLLKKYGLM